MASRAERTAPGAPPAGPGDLAGSSLRPGDFDVFNALCPSRSALLDVTGRWGGLCLAGLADGPMRFGELRRKVGGISDRMLAQTLDVLATDGLVEREVIQTMPPHVTYRLTAVGEPIAARMLALVQELSAALPAILAHRSRAQS